MRPIMVCEKCEAKLGKVITPDPWKSGARNTVESGGRKLNENKALSSSLKSSRINPVTTVFRPCRFVFPDKLMLSSNPSPFVPRICKQKVHQSGSHYCQACAYKKGICAMCGKKMLDTKNYRQSSTWLLISVWGTLQGCLIYIRIPSLCRECWGKWFHIISDFNVKWVWNESI